MFPVLGGLHHGRDRVRVDSPRWYGDGKGDPFFKGSVACLKRIAGGVECGWLGGAGTRRSGDRQLQIRTNRSTRREEQKEQMDDAIAGGGLESRKAWWRDD